METEEIVPIDTTALWTDVLAEISERLSPMIVEQWLTDIDVDISSRRIILTVENEFKRNIIERRLTRYIKDALAPKHIDPEVLVTCTKPVSTIADDQQLIDKIMGIWGPDYAFLGYVEIPNTGFYVLLKTTFKKGNAFDCVLILEMDNCDSSELSEHSFAIADESLIPTVFEAFCHKYKS